MRDDLLDAKASVDWPVSHFPALEQRLREWAKINVEIRFEELESGNPNYLVVAADKAPIPLAFNVEIGAYINTIRSALDILATSLAHRHGISKPDEAYFPVARSLAAFVAGNYKGSKFVKGLPKLERTRIESLNPYQGGNELLWFLHNLDIVRKHRRLIFADVAPVGFHVVGVGINDHFTRIATGWTRAYDKTILGFWAKKAPKPKVYFTPYIAIMEAGLRKPVVPALRDFAGLADSIINLFDY
jgi:hypothetical protein